MELNWDGKDETKARLEKMRESRSNGSVAEIESDFLADGVSVYHRDNIEFLLSDDSVYNIIYIDPPYNTRQKFSTYSDDFSIPLGQYRKGHGIARSVSLSSTQELDRIHSQWLDMMYIVLSLLSDHLAPDGIFFCSLDENEVHNAKLLCDEIFGPECFAGQLNWIRTETPANLSKKIKKKIEYILCYTGRENTGKFYGIEKKSKSSNGLMNQSNKPHELLFRAGTVEMGIPDGMYPAGSYGTSSYDITLLDDCRVEDRQLKNDIRLHGKFKWGQEHLDNFIAENLGKVMIASAAFSPSYIRYADKRDTPSNLISKADCGVGTSESATKALQQVLGKNAIFDYPKPVELIEYLCGFSGKREQRILDVFAGSGTTGIASLEHNEKTGDDWEAVLVERSEENIDIIKERIKKCTG